MDFTIFDHFKNLTVNKIAWDEKNEKMVSSYDIFRMNKILSFSEVFIGLSSILNKFNLSKKDHYTLLLNTLPKRQMFIETIRYAKNFQKEKTKKIQEYFEIGTRDLETVLNHLTEEQAESIISKYDR
jgi:hypothetical protein